ncbi:branched-chain alpha-ketoacid dehydrogenase [Obelidium mucronatum]|nr:branched-chain alpha-ketoacid dehydrogenase [Obelidium mucronatum]KAI9337210.1 branched-chain alpha-ketoacid dehydrogenase [Obelidium mucronatum]
MLKQRLFVDSLRRSKATWASSNSRVHELAQAPINPVTLKRLLDLGETKNLRESSLLLHSELPKRLARRVKAVQKLPFIVGVNPHIRSIYQLYLDSFEILSQLPEPTDNDSQQLFTDTLKDLVASHADVIPRLAKGFQECGRYMSREDAADFLDGMIHARIAIRVLAEHHLALQEPIPGYIGVLNTNLSPTTVLRHTADYVQELCEINYGVSPEFQLSGHLDTRITYISNHLEYIFMELLKNASRATVEHSKRISRRGEQPVVQITVARGPADVTIRVRDMGGGISPEDMARVFEYSYTTVPKSELEEDHNIFSSQSRQAMQAGVGGPIAGLGFGLPMSRIYAKYFGGSLELKSVGGHGVDVFLRVPNISRSDNKHLI